MMVASVAYNIWIRAIVTNSCFLLMYLMRRMGGASFLLTGGIIIGTVLLTLPLLPVIIIWLKCFCVLPYNDSAKLSWLAFVLMATAAAFFMAASLIFDIPLFNGTPMFSWALLFSLFSVAIAVFWTRKLIIRLT
jgi:hypothetical protein